MARKRGGKGTLRYGVLSVMIAALLWGIAHSSSSVERGYDIPVAFEDLPDELVITDQSDNEINIRVVGSRSALRNLSPTQMEYVVNVSGAKAGRAIHEVEVSQLDVPRGVRIVSRSPSQIDARFERRGRKNVRVRVEMQGEPAEGFALGEVELDPPRVWLTGARSRVLRISEAATETIELTGLKESVERQVRLSLDTDHVWQEDDKPIKVRVAIVPVEQPEVAAEAAGGEGGA